MPNRIIKESICTSDSLNGVSAFAENLFYRLIVNCDDFGIFDGRPSVIKGRCYPLKDNMRLSVIQGALSELEHAGCTDVYYVDGKPFLRLPKWELHQRVRSRRSKYPTPEDETSNNWNLDGNSPQLAATRRRNPIQSESESESGITPLTPLPGGTATRAKNNGPDLSEFSEPVQAAIREWLAYKGEKRHGYKPTGLKAFLSVARENVAAHGEAPVVALIRDSMANGWQGVAWDRLRKGGLGGGSNIAAGPPMAGSAGRAGGDAGKHYGTVV